jgi:hypothetical protein
MGRDCPDSAPTVKPRGAGGRAVDGLSASRVNPLTGRMILAVVLLGYGLYRALFVPGLMAASDPLLLVLFVLQALSESSRESASRCGRRGRRSRSSSSA